MLFKATGPVPLTENFYVLGLSTYPVHLLDGPCPVLFEGGTSCAGRLYVEAIRSVLGTRQPQILFLTHAHWDHCGAASYLKKAFPQMKITASSQTAQILKRPGALELIVKLNKEARSIVSNYPNIDIPRLLDGTFYPFGVDIEIEDGQCFDLGNGSTVEVLATPGHTRDHHSYYLPAKKILIAGDAVGCMDSRGGMACEFLYDYQAYLQNINKLAALPLEILCQGHRIVLVGQDEVTTFFNSSLEETMRFKNEVYRLLDAEEGSLERVVQRIKAEYYDHLPEPKQPEIPYLLNLTAKVNHLAARRHHLNKDL